MIATKFDTFAKYNRRSILIVRYGKEISKVRFLSTTNAKEFDVLTSHLRVDEYDSSDWEDDLSPAQIKYNGHAE